MRKLLILAFVGVTKLAFGQQTFEQMYSPLSWGNGCEFTDQLVLGDTAYVATFNIYNGTCTYHGEVIFFDSVGAETKRIYVPNFGETDLKIIEKGKQHNFFAAGIQYGCFSSDYVFILNADYLNGLLWYKQYSFPIGGSISVQNIIATPDSGCIILYTSNSTYNIRKLNYLGNTIYHKVVSNSIFPSAVVSMDSGFYLFSNQFDSLSNPTQILTKYNMNVDSLSSIVLNAQDIFGSKIILSSDSNFVMIGSFKDSLNHYKSCIAKLDTLGNLIWRTTLLDSIFQYTDIAETSVGTFLLSRVNLTNLTSVSSDVIRFNSIGDSISGKKYSNFPRTTIVSLSATNDGGYFAVGLADTIFVQLPYMLKADSLGNITGTRNLYSNSHTSIQVYPNPASEFITINSKSQNSLFTIWNATGMQIMTGVTNSPTSISDLAKGLYFVNGDNLRPMKFMKQ